jgi:hypothetical protein
MSFAQLTTREGADKNTSISDLKIFFSAEFERADVCERMRCVSRVDSLEECETSVSRSDAFVGTSKRTARPPAYLCL